MTMNDSKTHDIGVNVQLAKEIMSTRIYESDASALREQYVNALSHGCTAYHDKYGYTDDVFTEIVFDYSEISFEGVSNLNFIDLNPWWQGTLLSMFGHVNEYEVMKWIDNT